METFEPNSETNDNLISKSNSIDSENSFSFKKNIYNITCMSLFPIIWLIFLFFTLSLKISQEPKDIIYCYYNNTENDGEIKLFSDEFDLDQNLEIYINNNHMKKKREYNYDEKTIILVKINFRNDEINMENMFKNIDKLINITIELKDTTKEKIISTSMKSMFENCNSLTSFDINGITFNVSSTEKMFYNTSIILMDLTYFYSEYEIIASKMFAYCKRLINITTLKNNKNKPIIVKNSSGMFEGSDSLVSIDLSNLNTLNTTDISKMFLNCKSLLSISLEKVDTTNVINMSRTFQNCSSLNSIKLKKSEISNVEDMSYMFSGCESLPKIEFNTKYTATKLKDMSFMFYSCKSLTKFDFENINPSNLTNMSNMFSECISVANIDFSDFDASQVIDMEKLFYNNFNLKKLNLSLFDTSNIVNMKEMFYNCSKIAELDISSFNTSKVKNMQGMFGRMKGLKNLILNNELFDTSNVVSFNSMFYTCEKLTQLDVSSFKTSNATNFNQMFQLCSSLTYLDLTNFDTSNSIEKMDDIFFGCSNLIVAIDYSNEKSKKLLDYIPSYVRIDNKTKEN